MFNQLDNFALLKMWAYDYASAAMVVRTQLELAAPTELPVQADGQSRHGVCHCTQYVLGPGRSQVGSPGTRFGSVTVPGERSPGMRSAACCSSLLLRGIQELGDPGKDYSWSQCRSQLEDLGRRFQRGAGENLTIASRSYATAAIGGLKTMYAGHFDRMV